MPRSATESTPTRPLPPSVPAQSIQPRTGSTPRRIGTQARKPAPAAADPLARRSRARRQAQPDTRRAQCSADRVAGRGTKACRNAGRPRPAHARRHALLLPAPLRRLQPAQAHQEPVVWRAGHRDRHDPVCHHAADPRRRSPPSSKLSSATAPAHCGSHGSTSPGWRTACREGSRSPSPARWISTWAAWS